MHTVTLRQILDKNPCKNGMYKLLKGLNIEIPLCIEEYYYDIMYGEDTYLFFRYLTVEELNKPITLKFILENNGLEHALWCLKIFKESKEGQNLRASMLDIIKPQYLKKNPDTDFVHPSKMPVDRMYRVYRVYKDGYFTEDSEKEIFKTQVTELFIKHFC